MLQDAAEMLAVDAPSCAQELQFRWWAAHLAESEFELSAVAEVSSELAEQSSSTIFAIVHPPWL